MLLLNNFKRSEVKHFCVHRGKPKFCLFLPMGNWLKMLASMFFALRIKTNFHQDQINNRLF